MATAQPQDITIVTSEAEDLISYDEVERWSAEALKDFCRRRGYKVTGAKRELVARVFCLYNQEVPEEPTAREQEISRKKDYKTLVNFKYLAPDPIGLKRWQSEKEGLKNWPPVTYIDIHAFLRNNGSVGLTTEGLTAYKTGKAYSYFECQWLREVFYSSINPRHECCFLKTLCSPSTRINDEPHELWAKIIKKTGEVVSAFCSCMAGLSQTCNHVAALLFKIEAAYRLDLSSPAKTSLANEWLSPSSAKGPLNMKLQDMTFVKPSFSKGHSRVGRGQEPIKVDNYREFLVEDGDDISFQDFVKSLKLATPNASVFLPGRTPETDDIIVIEDTGLPAGADVLPLAKSSLTTADLLKKLNLCPEDIRVLETKTIGQGKNPLWSKLRKGRLTASNFYRVYTRIESLKKNPILDCSNLVRSFLEPTPLDHLPQIQRGRDLEASAVDKLVSMLGGNGHSGIGIRDCGLFIDHATQYLGASPDGIVSCDCCSPSLAEIKCPSTELKDLPYFDETMKLKTRHAYYGQIQGQMMVTGIKSTWFFVFYPNSDCHLELIKLNKDFCKNMRQNLIHFYELHMAPKLVLGAK